ncbi:hypothetical protein FOCC_FOCC014437, partial [Frankliniella occidentalis]
MTEWNMNAERKISAPAAPLSHVQLDGSPALNKLRGGAPDSNPGEARQGRKLSSLSSFDGQRSRSYLPTGELTGEEDEEMDHKLAQKLGISDSLSDGHITPGRTSFSSPMPLHPGILKHSDHDLRSHQNPAYEADDVLGSGPHGLPGPPGGLSAGGGVGGTPCTPGTASTTSPTSPFSLGSAQSGGSVTSQTSEPRRRVSIVVQEETEREREARDLARDLARERSKKLSTSSFASSVGGLSGHSHPKANDLHQHPEVTVAAVSPAVTVPCLFRLRGKGYGTAKGIPTLIIAISGIDDAASVAGFGIISSIMFSHDSLLYQIVQGPLSVVMGLGFGVLWGVLAKYVPERNDPFVVPMRVLMLFGGGLIAVLGSESIGLGGAGPLAVVSAAFVSCYSWTQQGWEFEENPVATAFEIFWMVFEPILFGLTGTMIKMDELDPQNVWKVIGALVTGFVNGKTPTIAENGVIKKKSCIEFMYNKVYPDRSIETAWSSSS